MPAGRRTPPGAWSVRHKGCECSGTCTDGAKSPCRPSTAVLMIVGLGAAEKRGVPRCAKNVLGIVNSDSVFEPRHRAPKVQTRKISSPSFRTVFRIRCRFLRVKEGSVFPHRCRITFDSDVGRPPRAPSRQGGGIRNGGTERPRSSRRAGRPRLRDGPAPLRKPESAAGGSAQRP